VSSTLGCSRFLMHGIGCCILMDPTSNLTVQLYLGLLNALLGIVCLTECLHFVWGPTVRCLCTDSKSSICCWIS
jgi:hypothetical protein